MWPLAHTTSVSPFPVLQSREPLTKGAQPQTQPAYASTGAALPVTLKPKATRTTVQHDVQAGEVEVRLAESVLLLGGQLPQGLQHLDQLLVSVEEKEQWNSKWQKRGEEEAQTGSPLHPTQYFRLEVVQI